MKYMLWSNEAIEVIKNSEEIKEIEKVVMGASRLIQSIIDEANQRHNEDMLIKDIETAKLKTELKFYKEIQGK